MAQRNAAKLHSEVRRLEEVTLAQQEQQKRCWAFLQKLRQRLDETDPKGAELIRNFLMDDNLFGDRTPEEVDLKVMSG